MNYTKVRRIGYGSGGVAFLVEHTTTKRLYVIKEVEWFRETGKEHSRSQALKEVRLIYNLYIEHKINPLCLSLVYL